MYMSYGIVYVGYPIKQQTMLVYHHLFKNNIEKGNEIIEARQLYETMTYLR